MGHPSGNIWLEGVNFYPLLNNSLAPTLFVLLIVDLFSSCNATEHSQCNFVTRDTDDASHSIIFKSCLIKLDRQKGHKFVLTISIATSVPSSQKKASFINIPLVSQQFNISEYHELR